MERNDMNPAPSIEPAIRRTHEPFIKVRFALWLLEQGANHVFVSIDGAEPDPHVARDALIALGFSRKALPKSKVNWTGEFTLGECFITIACRPGIDVSATVG